MSSNSLRNWHSVRATALDEIESAHRMVGGSGPGRRYATQQINQAYAMLLSSQFQGFCRDLHSESVDHLSKVATAISFQAVLLNEFCQNRKLDKGNPNPGNIGADFDRLGLRFWPAVEAIDARNSNRKSLLEELNKWRNAIAHQDFDPAPLGGRITLHLQDVTAWRIGCDGLAGSFETVLRDYIQKVIGGSPW
jgi:hypothetical protein